MGSLPSQFDNIRSSYNAQKENWTIEEMTTILAKEEDDIKKGRARTISVITNSSNQKRKIPPKSSNDQRPPFKNKNMGAKKNGPSVASTSNEVKSEDFKGSAVTATSLGTRRWIVVSLRLA